ncbi:MAG: hypothetical protein MRK02_13815 [Candidatus Scalindua sp.]|nr:hypothetical protein [Candidatus Scalindua sp.]
MGAEWSEGANAGTLTTIEADAPGLFGPLQGKALKVEIPANQNLGMNMSYNFGEEISNEPEEIYFRYYLRFSDDWVTVDGGKLPGISGTYDVAGWGDRRSDGTNGWSARGQFHPVILNGNQLEGKIPMGNYVYHAEMEDFFW